jgi:hypothetical protein
MRAPHIIPPNERHDMSLHRATYHIFDTSPDPDTIALAQVEAMNATDALRTWIKREPDLATIYLYNGTRLHVRIDGHPHLTRKEA